MAKDFSEKEKLLHIEKCVDYILEHESEDYARWCEEESRDPHDLLSNPHVYASALLARGLQWESE